MTDTVTLTILEELATPQMVAIYNDLPGARQVSRFSDRTTAAKRLEMALATAGMKLARVEGAPGEVRVVPVGAASNTRGPGALEKTITVLAETNPKRAGSASHARFALYRTGMTVVSYIEAAMATGISRAKARKDVYWDREHGYISVTE